MFLTQYQYQCKSIYIGYLTNKELLQNSLIENQVI